MYTNLIEKPLHNILLWFTSLTPGNSLAMGIILLALLTKIVIIIFIYHGHLNNIIHHQIKKHSDKLSQKYKTNKKQISNSLEIVYEHYRFNPFKGLLVVLIQFFVLFFILNFLYAGANSEFNSLELSIMENVFMASTMNTTFMGYSLFVPLNSLVALIAVFVIQFLSLELYLLTKRKLHRNTNKEELIEHIVNLVLSLFVVVSVTLLPLALTLYWVFFLLFGILRKIVFDKYIDQKIIKHIEDTEEKVKNYEEPKIRKFDEGFIFLIWRLFNPKSEDASFKEFKRKLHRKYIGIHHSLNVHHPQRKLYEEPFVWALVLFVLTVIGFNIWR